MKTNFKHIIKDFMTKREPLRSEPKCESPNQVVREFDRYGFIISQSCHQSNGGTSTINYINHE